MKDKETTLHELKELAEQFRVERNWGKHHSAKNLAISIALESAELLEKFQWDDYRSENVDRELADEIADIMVYLLYFSKQHNIDIAASVQRKLKKAAKKYPVSLFNKDRDKASDYWKIKKAHRGK
ncbi:MAG TPA: nucleotide pyrophosphohydrolase [Candidatus Saccharimonadales bacterium]|nr:nucleotide pyrophosphohydrolase [Candidatus Saccharimonadales bacterium]